MIDLLFDELNIVNLVKDNQNIVRDKCYASNASYMQVFNCAIKDKTCSELVLGAYQKVKNMSTIPDYVVYLKPNYEKIINGLIKRRIHLSGICIY